ncbi:MAG TPA: ketoacyl-ACP synthase III [Archangium sp.]|uniref:3-oxoacyl-ACP synthase III family protein n=1 Tax=Archangium sp. TaxID=1872627 RepID=UPI002E370276|nr:ketoacyl-ACP synthase III [Archangium sp.]HEX5752587.1 ketoacyl-ACP synthase III [Archangium sp.]
MFLHALGHFHPENLITNAFLQDIGLETDDAWIVERVGIRTRHTVLPLDYLRETRNRDVRGALEAALYSNAETGRRAALMALQRAGRDVKDVGMVVAGGCSPDECIPAEACRIAEALGIEAPSLDLNAACSSFCAQLHFLAGMRPERLPDFILVVNPENSTRVVDYADRSSCVLWGDGTSAALISPRIPGPWRITHTLLGGSPSGADKVKVPRAGHFTQQGSAVQAFAIKRASETFLALRAHYLAASPGRTPDGLSLIGHQANLRMLEAVQRRTEVPDAHHFYNVEHRGNCGASGAPTVLSENWDNPQVGDAVALAVVGSGLTWAGALLERSATAGA